MPVYRIQAPDGKIVSLEGPEGASHDEVIAQAQALYSPAPAQVNNLDDVLANYQNQHQQVQPPAAAPTAPVSPPIAPVVAPEIPAIAPALPAGIPSAVEAFGPPQPEAGYGEIFTKGIENAPASTVGALAGVGRGVMEAGSPQSLAHALLDPGLGPRLSLAYKLPSAAIAAGANAIFDNPTEDLTTIQNEAMAQTAENQPHINPGSTMKEIVSSASQSLPQQIPGLAASLVTRNPEFSLGSGMAISGGQAYGEQRAGGSDPDTAAAASVANAFAERVGEKLPLGELLNNPAGAGIKGAATKTVRTAAADAAGEGITQPLQDAVDKVTIKPNMTFEQALHNEAVALGAGALTGGVVAAPVAAVEARKAGQPPVPVDPQKKTGEQYQPPRFEPNPGEEHPFIQQVKSESVTRPNIPFTTPEDPNMVSMNPFEKPKDPQAPAAPIGDTKPATTVPDPARPAEPVVEQPGQPTAPPAKAAEPQPAAASAQPEEPQTLPANPPENKQPSEQTLGAAAQTLPAPKKVVTPDGSMEIDTQDEVVEADSLQKAGEDLQPRDRTKATSDLQIQKIANELDPERLGESRTTDQGAPIVGDDNIVESGNGRVAAIRQAYAANGESAAKYRAALAAKGHNVEGMKNPVLIRRRKTKLSPEDRVKFTGLSNKSSIAEMSSTEKARADAGQISDDILDLHKGGEPDSADNVDFIRSFMGKVVTGNETGALIGRDNRPTQEGIKRAKAALVAKAYDDPDLVENIFDSADPEVKAIGNVLRDRAPEFAQLGAGVRRGDIPKRFDIAKQLMEAVKTIRDAKRDGKSIQGVIDGTNQTSLIDEAPRDPMVEKLVKAMYKPGFGRMLSQPAIDRVLNQYVTQAREQKENDLFGENKTTPAELLDAAYAKVTGDMEAKAQGQDTFLDATEEDTNQSRAGKAAPAAGPFTADPKEVAKTEGRGFMDMSRNRDININKQVYEDAGHDPAKAANYPPLKQRKIVIDQIAKKFDMKVTHDGKMSIKDQIDHLADMYVGMNNMAASLGLPAKAMSLGGRISLILEGGAKPYLGVYSHGKTIGLPNKSNSFAHEWLHALDHYLMDVYGPTSEKSELLSQAVRREGVTDPAHPVQSSFAGVLNALFFDHAEIAAKILELEAQVQDGRTEKSRKEAAKTLASIKDGSYRGIKGKTDYYKNARQMPGGDYFASPHEMMARALEAYVGFKLDEQGVATRGISKLNVGYNSEADMRLAKTFPKMQERLHIFHAFDNFFSSLGESQILGEDATPTLQKNPDYLGVMDPKYWATPDTAGETAAKDMNWIRRQLAFIKQDVVRAREENAIQKEERAKVQKIRDTLDPKDPGFSGFIRRLGKSATDSPAFALWNHIWRTERTLVHAIERGNPGASALAELNDRIFTRPGEGTAVNETFSTSIARTINQGSVVLENLMSGLKRGVDGKRIRLSLAEGDQLRNAMLGLEVKMPKESKLTAADIEKTAAKLREFANQQWKNMKSAGLEVGYYEKGAWLRRHYLKDAIMADPQGFTDGAEKTYKDQFDETFPDGAHSAIGNVDDFIEVMKGILSSDPQSVNFNKKTIAKLQEAVKNEDGEKVQEIIEEHFDDVRDNYARLAASSWLSNLVADRSRGEFESTFPKPGFMKKRGLPPSADVHMKNFMETNVERILFHYMVAGNTAIAQKNALQPKGKRSMEQLLQDARNQGADSDDVTDLEASINRVIFGPETGPRAKRIGRFLSLMRMGGILMNLNKVVFSAVVEPQVIALKTRNVANLFKAYNDQLADMLKTNEGKYFQEVAQQLGAIGTDYADMMQQDRFGGGFETGLLTRQTMAKFFRYTGNTGITNIQSRVAIRAGYRWMNYIGNKYLEGTAKEKGMAERDFAELGIGKEKAAAFAEWLKNNDGRPDLSAASNDSSNIFGADFMKAVVRFRDQAIQHPKKEDRPALANHPVGSILYTGLGFTFSFWDNVVKAETKRVKSIAENEGGVEAAKVIANHVATVGAMVVVTMLVNALRMAIFDTDKWEEGMKEDPEGLTKLLFGRALENTNIAGPAYSVIWNMYRGSQFGRDPATSMSGMVLSNYLNWLQKGFELGGDRNSPNNTNSEREFAKQTYRVMAAPALTAALLHLPGPAKLLAVPTGISTMFINSNTTADRVADTVVGPKTKGGSGGKSESEPKEPKEPKEK